MKGTDPPFDEGTVGITTKALGSLIIAAKTEIQSITTSTSADDLGGNFKLRFMDSISIPISFNATAEEMKLSILSMKTLNDVHVTRQKIKQTQPCRCRDMVTWNVTFSTFDGDAPSLLVSTDDEIVFNSSIGKCAKEVYGLLDRSPKFRDGGG